MRRTLALLSVVVLLFVGLKAAPPLLLTSQGSTAISSFLSEAVTRGEVPGGTRRDGAWRNRSKARSGNTVRTAMEASRR